jgi:Tfp pilus assembly protein PilF
MGEDESTLPLSGVRKAVRLFLFFSVLAAGLLWGCSMPRIIILHDPLSAEEHNDLGVSYQERAEYDLAVREYERAAEMKKRWARPLINLGNVYASQADWSAAEKSYRQALRREPENAEAMNNLAWVLCRAGNTDAALVWANKAVASKADEPAFLDTLAEVQIARKDFAQARRTLDLALSLSPSPQILQSLRQKKALLEKSSP